MKSYLWMRWASLLLCIGACLPTALYGQNERPFGFGLRLDDAAYQAVPVAPTVELSVPQSVSMKAFTPYAGDQGVTASGVAWATAYSALTTLDAWQRFETDRAAITDSAWSPIMLYNQLRSHRADPQCQQKGTLTDALWTLHRDGTVRHAAFPPSCERTVTLKDRLDAQPSALGGFLRLFSAGGADKVTPIRQALAHGHPVVVAMAVPPSFEQVRGPEWQPAHGEMPYGWQALTIVGYDDERMGGAVEVLNSWGRFWGDDGFAWIRYADLERLVRYGFMLHHADAPLTLGVEARVQGAIAQGVREYEAVEGKIGIDVLLTAPGHLAVLGRNRMGEVQVLQPTTYIPFGHAPMHVAVPADFAARSLATGGLDMAVLATAAPFDVDDIASELRHASGDWSGRVDAVLASRLAAGLNRFGAEVRGRVHEGGLVPLILHVRSSASQPLESAFSLLEPMGHAAPGRAHYTLQARDTVLTVSGIAYHPSGIDAVRVQSSGGALSVVPGEDGRFNITLRPEQRGERVVLTARATNGEAVVRELDLEPPASPDWVPPQITVATPLTVPTEIEAAQPAATDRVLTVTGDVADASAVVAVTINGVTARLEGTAFSAEVLLPRTERHFQVTATDTSGNTAHQVLYVPEADEDISLLTRQKAFGGDEAAPEQDYVAVQVYYATDRDRSGSTKLAQFYSGERGELEFGVAQVSIPEGHTAGEVEKPAWWRFEFQSSPSKHITLLDIAPYDRADVLQSMRHTIATSEEKQVLVFVHGYNVSFAQAVQRTAQLAHDLPLDGAPFLYSWPSDGALMAYGADEEDVAWSVPHLVDVLETITQETGAEKIHVLAHSMGNRAVVGALEVLAERYAEPLLDQVVFTAPDIDAADFEAKHVPAIHQLANRLTLYTSAYDKALIASKVRHGAPRAGDSSDYLIVSDLLDTVDADQIDMSVVGLGHSYFAEVQSALRDLFDLLHHNRAPDARNLIQRTRSLLSYWLLPTPLTE
ncbi:MAG: hypothetical protein RhofKO_22400 [Rhodothermales bacterium]